MSGPKGLLRSLIAQVILLHRRNLGSTFIFLDESLLDEIARRDVRGLCEVLGALLCQVLQTTSVICVIDGISEFECSDNDWEEDTLQIVAFFRLLISQTKCDMKLKILLTAANRSISSYRQLRDEDCISLSARHLSAQSSRRQDLEHDWEDAIRGT